MIFAHTWEEAEMGCKPRPNSNSSALCRGPVASQRPGCQACSADGLRPQCREHGASQVVLVAKNPPANAGDIGDVGSIPGLGRSPGGGHGSPLQYSCLYDPVDRGVWWATVHRVAKSQTRLK